jgi:hypothetical protein
MTKTKIFLAVGLTVLTASAANAATLAYRFKVDGALAGSAPLTLAAGDHTLTIEGQVTDNDLGGGNNGGIFQSAINLDVQGPGLVFVQGKLPITMNPDGKWNASFNSQFNTNFKGEIGTNPDFEVFAHTASIAPGDQGARFNAVGAGEWSEITTGPFTYDGVGMVTVALTAADGLAGQRVAGFDGANITSVPPAEVLGATLVVGIPEPASMALAAFGMIGAVAARRRFA